MAGSGTVTLSGDNTYTGGTVLDGGVLDFANGSLPFSTTAPDITFAGGTLQWAPGNTEDVSAGIAPVAAGETISLDTNGNNVTLASPLSGDGGLTAVGTGTLTLTAANTYAGGTDVEDGTVVAGSSSALGTGSLTMADGTALVGSGGNETVFGAVTISGNVTLVSQGSNTLTFTGPIELGSNPLTVTGLGEVVLAGQVSVNDGLTKLGCGTLVLAGDNAYTGGTTVNGGVLDVAAPSALPGYDTSGAVSVSSGGGLAVYVGGTNDWSLADLAILWSHATFVSGMRWDWTPSTATSLTPAASRAA